MAKFPDPALQPTFDPYTAGLPLGCPGGVAERSKAAVLKTAERKLRGFESLLLRKHDNRIVSRRWSGRDASSCASRPSNRARSGEPAGEVRSSRVWQGSFL